MKNYTLVIGASENEERYSNKAIKMLKEYEVPTLAISKRKGSVLNVSFITDIDSFENKEVDTITLYIGPKNQGEYFELIKKITPRRVIFNPGTENPELVEVLNSCKINYTEACTLVLLRTNQY